MGIVSWKSIKKGTHSVPVPPRGKSSSRVTTHDIRRTLILIFGRYPVDILDIRLMHSVETLAGFRVILSIFFYLTTVLWNLVPIHKQLISFYIFLISDKYFIDIRLLFCWYLFNAPLISGLCLSYPDIRCTDFLLVVTPWSLIFPPNLQSLNASCFQPPVFHLALKFHYDVRMKRYSSVYYESLDLG